jgi:TP901 family phage tail tape measure protein
MADVEKQVRVAFEGDDRISKTIQGINKNVQGFASSVEGATQPLADLTDNLLLAEAAFVALAVGGLAYAVTQAGAFGDAFSEITTLIDLPKDSLNEFKLDIIDYARDSTQSIEEINQAIYNAISAGIDYEDALSSLADAERLGIATKASLNEAISVLVPTLNAFGKGADDAADFADILFTTVKTGKTTLPELETSLSQVTGTAANAGVSFDEMSAAIAALTAQGAPTSQAITQVRSAMVALIKPSSQAQEAAKELGIEFNAEALAAKGLEGVFKEVFEATGGNVTVMGQLFGRVEGLNAALVLGADTSGKFRDALDAMADRAGNVEEAYGKMADNFALINQRLVNNLKATLIEAGTPLLDDWAGIAEGISDIFEGVSISFGEGSFDPLFTKIEELAGELTAWLEGLAAALPEAFALIDWDEFENSIDNVIGELIGLFKSFFGELDLTKPEDLAEAIQKMVDAFTLLNNVVSGILESFQPFISALSDYIDTALDSDEETQKLAGNILGLGKVANELAGFVGGLSGALDIATGSLAVMAGSSAFNTIINLFGQFGTKLTGALTGLGQFAAYGASFGVGWLIGDWMVKNIPLVDEFATGLADIVLGFQGLDEATIAATESGAKETEELGKLAVATVQLAESLGDLPSQKITDVDVKGGDEAVTTFEEMLAAVQAVPETKETDIRADADIASAESAVKEFDTVIFPDGKEVTVISLPNKKSLEDTKDAINEIPPEKILEIQLKHDVEVQLANIEAAAETTQTALEWSARVDIAEVEAARDILLNASDNLADAFENTGDVISAMVGELGNLGALAQLELFEIIEREMLIRERLAEQEIKLSEAQIAYLNARTAALEKGDAIINISMDGVYPELEMVMWKIIEQVQIRASAEGLEFLVGL